MASLRRPTVWIGRSARPARVGAAVAVVVAAVAVVGAVAVVVVVAGVALGVSVAAGDGMVVSLKVSPASAALLRDLLDLERHRLLRGVRVLGTRVHLELLD